MAARLLSNAATSPMRQLKAYEVPGNLFDAPAAATHCLLALGLPRRPPAARAVRAAATPSAPRRPTHTGPGGVLPRGHVLRRQRGRADHPERRVNLSA
jgi:hypothetical protein